MTPESQADDPITEEARRARQASDRSLLPSNDGLGPGAGETPAADVSVPAGEDPASPATSTPTLGGAPVREERPVTRSSQLDGAPPERDADSG